MVLRECLFKMCSGGSECYYSIAADHLSEIRVVKIRHVQK